MIRVIMMLLISISVQARDKNGADRWQNPYLPAHVQQNEDKEEVTYRTDDDGTLRGSDGTVCRKNSRGNVVCKRD